MIPANAHFIWIGTELPFPYVLAARSAAMAGGFERVFFHHTDDLSLTRWWPFLQATKGVVARPLDPSALLFDVDPGGTLQLLYKGLSSRAAQSNVLRIALLHRDGGVYLDTDTLTHRSFGPLCERTSAFCGLERVVFPRWVKESRDPWVKMRALGQTTVRNVLGKMPFGWRAFHRIEHHYPEALNNAVLASEPGHAMTSRLIGRIKELVGNDAHDAGRNRRAPAFRRYALGPHLLQNTVASMPSVEAQPPSRFYPLSPELSAHWFRSGTARYVDEMIREDNLLIHWYASVSTRKTVREMTPDWVQERASTVAFCRLAAPFCNG